MGRNKKHLQSHSKYSIFFLIIGVLLFHVLPAHAYIIETDNINTNLLRIEDVYDVSSGAEGVIVPIYLDIKEDLFSLTFDIIFDPSRLEATALERDTSRVLVSLGPDAIDNINGRIIVNILNMAGQTAVTTGQGKLLDMVFNIKDLPDDTILEIKDIRSVYDIYGRSQIISIENGRIDPNIPVGDITFDLDLPSGWSMISLPLIPENTLVSSLLPNAVVVYGYEKGSGYVRVKKGEGLIVGKGYWVLFSDEQSYPLKGKLIHSYTHTINEAGWEMIGGCTSESKALTDNCNIGVIYGYDQDVGYQRVLQGQKLEPGNGYWILFRDITESATLTVGPFF